MARTVTAADIQKLAYQDRLPLFLNLRRASMNPALTQQQRALYRLASRFIRGNTDSPAYDMLARLQILEGVAGIVSLKPMVAGPWSKNPRQGMKAAKDFFEGQPLDPEWFSLQNTGLISKVRGMIRQEYSKWTRGREVHFDPDDILQNGLMGMTKDGKGQLDGGPLMIQFGHNTPGIRKGIPEGRVSPSDTAGIAAKFFVKKIRDQFQLGDKSRAPSEDAMGNSVLDMQPGAQSSLSFASFAEGLLSSGSPLGLKLERDMRTLARTNPVALALIDKFVAGEDIGSISGIHKELGGSGSGSSVGWVKEKFYPAVMKLVQDDPDLLAAYWKATGGVRFARRRAAALRAGR